MAVAAARAAVAAKLKQKKKQGGGTPGNLVFSEKRRDNVLKQLLVQKSTTFIADAVQSDLNKIKEDKRKKEEVQHKYS
jgi:hypothetical protein